MLEIGFAKSKDSSLESALEDNWVNPIKEMNHLLCNLIQTERSGISLAIPNDETVEVDHLLVEPHVTEALDDDFIYLNSESIENCVNVGGYPCSTGHYDQRDDCGILDVDTEQVGRQALKYEFMLQGPEEKENLHITCNLSCDCSDYLLEVLSAENSLDYSSNSEATVRNMEHASQIQFMERIVDQVKPDYIAENFSIATLDDTIVAPDTTITLEAQEWLKHELLFDQQNFTGFGNVSDVMESVFLCSENEDDVILIPGNEMPEGVFRYSSKNELPYGDYCRAAVGRRAEEISGTMKDSVMNAKRLRRPTRRYIEETSEIKPRGSYGRLKMPPFSSKERLLHARTEEKHCWSGAVQPLYQDHPAKVHSLRGCRRKSANQLVKDDSKGRISPSESAKIPFFQGSEQQDDASDESLSKIRKRRKHHRQWTLSEVVNLVDGVSQYGVGRWTEIKRLFFSASAYRTAVDLKDKWRNLLRAKVEPPKKQASAPMPQSILRRVRDLSVTHPYPRSQKSRITDLPIIVPPT